MATAREALPGMALVLECLSTTSKGWFFLLTG